MFGSWRRLAGREVFGIVSNNSSSGFGANRAIDDKMIVLGIAPSLAGDEFVITRTSFVGFGEIALGFGGGIAIHLVKFGEAILIGRLNKDAEYLVIIAQDVVGGAANNHARASFGNFLEGFILRFNGIFNRLTAEIEGAQGRWTILINFANKFRVEAAIFGGTSDGFFVIIRDLKLLGDEFTDIFTSRAMLTRNSDNNPWMGSLNLIGGQAARLWRGKSFEITANSYKCDDDADKVGDRCG